MNYKIYSIGNYLRIQNIESGEIYNGLLKEVFVDKNNLNNNLYKIQNVKDWSERTALNLNQIKKEDGSDYTLSEWETFYSENTGNFNQGGATPQNQTYEVKLSQFGKVSQNDGFFVIGEKYLINAYSIGDDFTNVGASENFTGVEFIATGTTPTSWINGSQLISNYEPLITEVENTLTTSTITYESVQIGFYRFLVNDPNDIVVTAYANTSFNGDLFPFEIVTCFVAEDNRVFVELKRILILGTELITESAPLFESFNVKINIKKIN